jgi:ABC-2 type transport system ATP-binding protein
MEHIRIEGLKKHFGDLCAVDGLTMSVEKGELISLLGVNGAGKSTTVRILCCLVRPDGGDAYIAGRSVTNEPREVKRLIAVSPQESAIASGLTVKENLELIAGAHGFSREKKREKIEELSGMLSLGEVLDRRAGKLSGGWRRRLSIGMALISEPEVLFLDEPTLGLDVIARAELWDIVRSLKGRVTVVLTTHYMEEAESLSDRVAIMDRGRLIAYDTVEGIKRSAGVDSFEMAFIKTVRGGDGDENGILC